MVSAAIRRPRAIRTDTVPIGVLREAVSDRGAPSPDQPRRVRRAGARRDPRAGGAPGRAARAVRAAARARVPGPGVGRDRADDRRRRRSASAWRWCGRGRRAGCARPPGDVTTTLVVVIVVAAGITTFWDALTVSPDWQLGDWGPQHAVLARVMPSTAGPRLPVWNHAVVDRATRRSSCIRRWPTWSPGTSRVVLGLEHDLPLALMIVAVVVHLDDRGRDHGDRDAGRPQAARAGRRPGRRWSTAARSRTAARSGCSGGRCSTARSRSRSRRSRRSACSPRCAGRGSPRRSRSGSRPRSRRRPIRPGCSPRPRRSSRSPRSRCSPPTCRRGAR